MWVLEEGSVSEGGGSLFIYIDVGFVLSLRVSFIYDALES